MRTRWLLCTIVFFTASYASAQMPKFITLGAAIPGKVAGPSRSGRRSAPPLNPTALLAAMKSSTKSTSTGTADYLTLTASQPFVNNKGSLVGDRITLRSGADGGSIEVDGGRGASLSIYLTPTPAAKIYLVEISGNMVAGESLSVLGPDSLTVKSTYTTTADQHLILMVTPTPGDTTLQHIGLTPSKLFTFYSCKVSILK